MLHRVDFRANAFDYSIGIRGGFATDTPKGWTVSRDGGFVLELGRDGSFITIPTCRIVDRRPHQTIRMAGTLGGRNAARLCRYLCQ